MEEAERAGAPADIYSAENIVVLKGLEAVRKRPGMYIGDTSGGSGLHSLVHELVDNAVGEQLAGYGDLISVTLNADGSVTVEDNGRGLPTENHPRDGVSRAEVILTQLHAGGQSDPDVYRVKGGLRGVGISVVNALSSRLELTVWRGGREHFMAFTKGEPEAPLREVGEAQGHTGTRITFTPDSTIFASTVFCHATLEQRMREVAFLIPPVRIRLEDRRAGSPAQAEFHTPEGVRDFVKYLGREHRPLFREPVYVKGERGRVAVEAAFWWNDGGGENMMCYTNTVLQRDGGTHAMGFRAALARAVNIHAAASGGRQGEVLYAGALVRNGFTGVLSVKMPNPDFAGCTREKLASLEVRRAVHSAVSEGLGIWLREHPREAGLVLKKIAGARERKA